MNIRFFFTSLTLFFALQSIPLCPANHPLASLDDLSDLPTQYEPSTVRFFKKHPYALGATVTGFACFLLLNFDPDFRKAAKKAIACARNYINQSTQKCVDWYYKD